MKKVLIIAEVGVNHNGDVRLARKLIDEATCCGADVVKFQTFDPEKIASKHAAMADYQKKNLGTDESQVSMLGKLALKPDEFAGLCAYCKEKNIRFMSTPFDIGSVKILDGLQDIWKIPSGEITNYPYLVEIAKTGKEVILSTGMSTLDEVKAAIDVLKTHGCGKLTLLHCTTNYPTPMQDVNLNAMLTLGKMCGCPVGYSDHTQGIEVPVAAVAMGAEVIEKHFTLDRNMDGPDHKASLEPDEMAEMISAIRNIELAMGDGQKQPSASELKNIPIVRKSIVAACRISRGDLFTQENLTTKRPGTGISPMRWNDVLGTKAIRDFAEDELIEI